MKERLERFFDELAPRLETARVLDEELDRSLARRFNVLDYLRTDELGLSRIIADLLDPKGSHGQGVLFLRGFLANLRGWKEHRQWPDLDRRRISVDREWHTEQGRKVDIVVTIEGPADTRCLAFENKPYALDQKDQVRDYLGSLKGKYGEDFLLIYLPPTGKGPSESSVHKDELAKWKNHFAIMPYVERQEEWEDGFDDYRLEGHSLADWLGECRKNCEVDRLRWFLADLETFCQWRFGGQAMTTDGEGKTVQKFVLEDPTRIETAATVYESWPAIKNGVCSSFLKQLCAAIHQKARAEDGEDMRAASSDSVDEGKYTNWICLYRDSWAQYKGTDGSQLERCSTICLQNQERGPNGWCIGVASPVVKERMTPREKSRRRRLEDELKSALGSTSEENTWWPWRSSKVDEYGNWDSMVLALQKENQNNGGPITNYFVGKFIEIANKAVPIINDIEGPGKT